MLFSLFYLFLLIKSLTNNTLTVPISKTKVGYAKLHYLSILFIFFNEDYFKSSFDRLHYENWLNLIYFTLKTVQNLFSILQGWEEERSTIPILRITIIWLEMIFTSIAPFDGLLSKKIKIWQAIAEVQDRGNSYKL